MCAILITIYPCWFPIIAFTIIKSFDNKISLQFQNSFIEGLLRKKTSNFPED